MKIFQSSLFIVVIISLAMMQSSYADHRHDKLRICSQTAGVLKTACSFEVKDDYFEGIAVCINMADKEARRFCIADTRQARDDARQECREIFRARRELCNDIGEAPYDPPFGPSFADNFVDPLQIGNTVAPNPYFPLVSGNQWVYRGVFVNDEGEEETETINVTVTDKTKLIEGITCVVVNDVVTEGEDEALVEDTDDWYAQDIEGNVWYCGEIAENFEFFEGDNPEVAELVDIDGSWKAGRDGAKAGILFPAIPDVGEVIRQEVAWGDAEDVIEILSLTGNESSPAASCDNNCLVTKDFTPLDPGVEENKYFVPGIGQIVEINLETGERVELIEFNQP